MSEEKYITVQLDNKGYVSVLLDDSGVPNRTILLESPIAKQFAAYCMAKKDIDLVIDAISQCRTTEITIVKQSLTAFAITTYAKCFVGSRGRGLVLQSKQVFKDYDANINKVHNYVIELRHDYIAHAGNKYDLCPVTAFLIVNKEKSDSYRTAYKIKYKANMIYLSYMVDELDDFEKACGILKEYLIFKKDEAFQKLSEETKSLGLDELLKKSFIPDLSKQVIFENFIK